MRIDKVSITNFRGFEYKEVPFNKDFVVVVGENASGKTTLLKALEVSLGAYLQCLHLPPERVFKRQFNPTERFVKWNTELKDYLPNDQPTSIKTEGLFLDAVVVWTREMLKDNTTTHNRRLAERLMDAVDVTLNKRKNGTNTLVPIVASYGIERTVAQLRKSNVKQERRSRMEKAFVGALRDNVDFEGVIEWLHSYDSELKYEREFPGTREALFEAIQTAIPYLEDIDYNSLRHQIEAFVNVGERHDGKKLHSNMSDGFKAMLNIAAELAYRCVVLNGFLGKDAVKQTPGVVLIDELDMHLHPNWQKHVVRNLKAAFPQIQFIATTHSPFIIQSLKKEQVLLLDHDEMTPEDDPDRKGIEDIADDEMAVNNVARSEPFVQMEKDAARYFDLVAEGKTLKNDAELATLNQKLEEYEKKYGDDPAFVALLKSERKANKL